MNTVRNELLLCKSTYSMRTMGICGMYLILYKGSLGSQCSGVNYTASWNTLALFGFQPLADIDVHCLSNFAWGDTCVPPISTSFVQVQMIHSTFIQTKSHLFPQVQLSYVWFYLNRCRLMSQVLLLALRRAIWWDIAECCRMKQMPVLWLVNGAPLSLV